MNTVKKLLTIGISLLFLVCNFTFTTLSYENNGRLSGYITDKAMNPIMEAKVTLECGDYYFECYSNDIGFFYQDNIPIVDCYWMVTVTKLGYEDAYIEIPIDENTIHDFILSPTYTIYVDDDNIDGPWDGSEDYPYQFIQDAIDNATYGDTIFVYNGTYCENIVIDMPLNLIGEDKATTIIDGRKLNNSISLVSQGITVSGFSITNGSNILKKEVENWFYAGIRVTGSNNKIFNNIIYNNTLGIFCKQATNLSICHNTFYNDGINIYPYELERIRPSILKKYFVHNIYNNTVNGKPLLYYLDKSDFTVPSDFGQLIAVNCKNLEIKNANLEKADFEVMLVFCSNCLIEKCNFETNDGAFTLLSSHNNVFRYNSFKTSFHGLLLDYGSKFNTIEYNIFSKNKYCGVMIEYFSNFNHVSKNNFYENYAGAFLDKSFGNKYRKNYWDDWSGFGPVIIYDHIDFYKELNLPFSIIPLGFDWFPAKEPYDL